MAKRGRKSQPSHVLDARGAFEKNPQRKRQEPLAPEGRPDPPSHLGRIAKNEWRRLCDEMRALGVLSQVDRGAIEIAATAYQQYRELGKWLEKNGHKNARGSRVPESYRYREAVDRYCKMLAEFGLTPSSRASLQVKPADGAGKVGEFLRNRKQRQAS